MFVKHTGCQIQVWNSSMMHILKIGDNIYTYTTGSCVRLKNILLIQFLDKSFVAIIFFIILKLIKYSYKKKKKVLNKMLLDYKLIVFITKIIKTKKYC